MIFAYFSLNSQQIHIKFSKHYLSKKYQHWQQPWNFVKLYSVFKKLDHLTCNKLKLRRPSTRILLHFKWSIMFNIFSYLSFFHWFCHWYWWPECKYLALFILISGKKMIPLVATNLTFLYLLAEHYHFCVNLFSGHRVFTPNISDNLVEFFSVFSKLDHSSNKTLSSPHTICVSNTRKKMKWDLSFLIFIVCLR